MKIRNGYVSNSSSSSFIVISESDYKKKYNTPLDQFIIGKNGETEFGWDLEEYCEIASKINFAYLQALYMENNDYVNMIVDAIKNYYGDNCDVDRQLSLEYSGVNTKYTGYIDHQSTGYEEPDNLNMFESADILHRFLFNCDSHVTTGNDNR